MSSEDVDSPKISNNMLYLEQQLSPHSKSSAPSIAEIDSIDSWFNIGFDKLNDTNRETNIIVLNNKKIATVGYPLCKKFLRIKQLVKRREAGWRLLHNQVALLPELLNMVQNCERRMEVMLVSLDKIEKMCKRKRLSQHDKALVQIDATIQKKINQYKRKRDKELSVARSRLKKQQEALDFKKKREKAIRDSKGAPASKLEFGRMFFKTTTVPRTAKTLEAEANNPNDNKNCTNISATFINEEKNCKGVDSKPLSSIPSREKLPRHEEISTHLQSEEIISEPPTKLKSTAPAVLSSCVGDKRNNSATSESSINKTEAKEDTEISEDDDDNQNILGDFWGDSDSDVSISSVREIKHVSYIESELLEKDERYREKSIQSSEDFEPSASVCLLKDYLESGGWQKYLELFKRAEWKKDNLEQCRVVGDLIMIGVLPQDAKLMIEWLQKMSYQNEQGNRTQIPVGSSIPKESIPKTDDVMAKSSTSESKLSEEGALLTMASRGACVDLDFSETGPSPVHCSELTNEEKIETTDISEIPAMRDDIVGSPVPSDIVVASVDNTSHGFERHSSMSPK